MAQKLKFGSSEKQFNTHFATKRLLRRMATENLDQIRVLDLFAGENALWHNFDLARYYSVEKVKGRGKNIYGDNMKFIPSLDLGQFNVIDLDSYGVPVPQLNSIFENETLKPGTVILFTLIFNGVFRMNKCFQEYYNLNRISKKCSVILHCTMKGLFYDFLYRNGVRRVTQATYLDNYMKTYGFFVVEKR